MRHFQWNQEHEVFISQLDAEHRGLFEAADTIERAIEAHAPASAVGEQLHVLAAQIVDHFAHEEWLMQSVSYPSYGWHRQQHDTARRRLKLFMPMVESGDTEATELFLEFLAGWLQDHTGVTDRMMASFVRNYERSHATNAFERWGTPLRTAAAAAGRGATGPYPTTIRDCRVCGTQTTHQMRPNGLTCVKCAERSVSADLDRD